MRLAGIDIGTLTCRLFIADMGKNGQMTQLFSDRKILRLGEGVDEDKRLKLEAMARVSKTVRGWRQAIEAQGVKIFTAVATSAVRDAQNRDEFLAQMKEETGIEIEVISGEEEARRTLLGIRSGLPDGITDLLALDIGGGSTEFIFSRNEQKPNVISLDVGVVRITERFFKTDPPAKQEIHDAEQMIISLTKEAMNRIGEIGKVMFVGTAGTITTLSAMAQGLTTYDPAKIHNYSLELSTVRKMEKDLFHQTKASRCGLAGLEPGREEVIVAGILILRCIMEHLGHDRCLVSEYGLREGVLVDLANRHYNFVGSDQNRNTKL